MKTSYSQTTPELFNTNICNENTQLISEELRLKLCEWFSEKFGKCIFRRVVYSRALGGSKKRIIYHEGYNDNSYKIKGTNIPLLTSQQYEYQIDHQVHKVLGFVVVTTREKIRDTDTHVNKSIICNSKNMVTLTERFDVVPLLNEYLSIPRKGRTYENMKVEGDLICIFDVEPYTCQVKIKGINGNFNANKWFVCSEQFLRLWTLVLYNVHDSFCKIYGKLNSNWWKKMSSKLMVNTPRKYIVLQKQNDLEIEKNKPTQHFSVIRTETKKFHVHVYIAFVAATRFGILLNNNDLENIPNLIGKFGENILKFKSLDLDPDYINFLITIGNEK